MRNQLVAGIAGACALIAIAGCASSPQTAPRPISATPRLSAVALPGEAALAWRRSAGGLADFERWEFSRNDATVNATGRAPLLGSREWPEPLGPPERPVLFWLWRQ